MGSVWSKVSKWVCDHVIVCTCCICTLYGSKAHNRMMWLHYRLRLAKVFSFNQKNNFTVWIIMSGFVPNVIVCMCYQLTLLCKSPCSLRSEIQDLLLRISIVFPYYLHNFSICFRVVLSCSLINLIFLIVICIISGPSKLLSPTYDQHIEEENWNSKQEIMYF